MIVFIDDFITKGAAARMIEEICGKSDSAYSIPNTVTASVEGIIKEKFNSDVSLQFEMARSSPSIGHPWHYDGAKPEGVTQAEHDGNYSKPWKNKKLVDNHAAMNAFTSILLLSDPSSYRGGELNIYDEVNDTILKFRENHYLALLIFPSKNTYQHMCTPITSGQRFSHIAWYKEI